MLALEKIKQYIIKHSLIKHHDTIIAGLSGGPDSVFLLHMLSGLQEKYNLTLIAAHLNHEWRPEADAEEELCRTIATKLGIHFISTKLSSLSITKKYNGSKEEYARYMRRKFL
jgi:tRNA(Ile)-lysidine synthase